MDYSENTIKLSNFKDLESVVGSNIPIQPLPKHDPLVADIMRKSFKPKYEMDIERRKLVLIIQRYEKSRFRDFLASMNIDLSQDSIDKFDNRELEKLLDDCRYTISQKNGNNMIETGSLKAIEMMESFLTNIYKIDGLSKVLKSNEQFLDTLTELSLEYANLTYISPEKRMAYIVLSNAMMVHQSHEFFTSLSQTEEGKLEILKIHKSMEENKKN
jgi:hypothetical protein